MAAITLDIGGNTRRLDRDIQKTVNKVYNINLKTKGDQPLGRITGQVNEFNKSLDASNARVIAFGASAGIIFGVERAFTALLTSVVEVQKSLQDINVILNVSTKELQKFGGELFNIARNTGQSFQAVAEAATEFSRQGLGVEETLKRTSDALILSRLSGLDTVKSVEALTAAVNSFASQAVSATEVVNKFATVDAAFAVSSADLADAVARVGSSAAQSGVSLNELIAIVTSAQQTTARGGAVIGNSFKTIFTRLQRTKVVSLLESLGVETVGAGGQIKSTIQLLQDLGTVYDTLGAQQQAYVAEQVGGVFQINILKAALADLGKEYSIYNNALNVSAGATDQAVKRNEELNKTYAAQLNALQENARQLAAVGGERLFGPSIERLVGGTNQLLAGFNESEAQGFGTVLGRGILDGLGQFIAGPGLVLIGGVLLKLFKDLAKFATGSVQQLLGLNTAATQQLDLQASISQILSKNPQLIELALQGEKGLNQAANQLLSSLQQQTVELQKQSALAAQLSKAFVGAGVRMSGGIPVAPTPKSGKAGGYIPNFASQKSKIGETIGAYQAGYEPGRIFNTRLYDGQGGSFMATVNSAESINTIVGPNGNKGTFVVPPTESAQMVAAKGFVPNFATPKKGQENKNLNKEEVQRLIYQISNQVAYLVPAVTPGGGLGKDGIVPQKSFGGYDFPQYVAKAPLPNLSQKTDPLEEQVKKSVIEAASRYTTQLEPLGLTASVDKITRNFKIIPGAAGALQGAVGSAFEVGIISALDYEAANRDKRFGDFDVRGGAGLSKVQELFGIQGKTLADFKATTSDDAANSFRDKILKEAIARSSKTQFTASDATPIVKSKALSELRADLSDAELERNFTKDKGRYRDLKSNADPALKRRLEDLIAKKRGLYPQQYPRSQAKGYIPNFVDEMKRKAIRNESKAGVPKSTMYFSQEKALADANSMSLGLFNTIDEPDQESRNMAMQNQGFAAKGYIPNFALADQDIQGTGLATAVSAVVAQLGFLAFSLQGSGEQYKNTIQELTKANVESAQKQTKIAQDRVLQEKDLSKRPELRKEYLATKSQEKVAARGTGMQRLTAASKSGGFGLALAGPILGETIKNAIGQESAGARQAGTAASAAGEIAGFAGTGAIFGPKGAAVGAAVGALLTIPKIISSFTSDFPELSQAAKKAGEELTKFSDSGAKLLTSFETLQKGLEDPGTSQEVINKASEEYAKILSGLSAEDQKRLSAAAKTGKLESEYAKVLSEKTAELQSREAAADLGKVTGEVGTRDFIRKGLGTALGGALIAPNAISQALGGPSVQDYIDYYLPSQTGVGTQASKTNMDVFGQAITQGKTGQGALDALQKAGGADVVKQLLQVETGDVGALEALLNKVIPEQEGKADIISQYIDQANNNAQDFQNVVGDLGQSFIQNTEKAKNAKKAGDELTAATQAEAVKKKVAVEATNKITESLERNIRVAQFAAESERKLSRSREQFSRQELFADRFTRKTETAGAIVGTDAPLAQAFSLREEVAGIAQSQIEGIENIKFNFVDTINSSINDAFKDATGKTIGEARQDGTAKDITKTNDQLSGQAFQQTRAFKEVQSVLNKYLQSSGTINLETLLSQIDGKLADANVNAETRAKIGVQLKEESSKVNSEIKLLKQESVQSFKKLAKEQLQRILIQKISQAQSFGGGIDEFINPKEPGQGVFDKVLESTKAFDQFQGQQADFRFDYKPGTNEFKYGYGAAQKARQEMAPEYGREALKLIGNLQSFTGYTPDSGGKAYQAGVAGVEEFLRRQVTELQTVAKSSETPQIVRDEINSALSTIPELGGLKTIAQLQVARQTGALDETQYEAITKKYQDPVLQALRERATQVGGTQGDILLNEVNKLAKDRITTEGAEPTVEAINTTNSILNDILTSPGINGQRSNDVTDVDVIADRLLKNVQTPTGEPTAVKAITEKPEMFAQQEAALNTNTGALNSLTGGLESLRNIIANLQTSFETAGTNQNNNTNANTGGQPSIQTTTNAPVNVIVNAESSGDIAAAVGEAVQNAIPSIIDKVKVALGQKVPPKAGG
jgi:TP901 family phage tail tape measure protein